MNEFDRQLKDMLEHRAGDAGSPKVSASKVIRRVRVRQAVSGLVAASMVGLGAVLVPQVMADNSPKPLPPVTSPTESPAQPDILPGAFVLGDDPTTEKRIEVAEGMRQDVAWILYIYKQEGIWCQSFLWDGDAGGCPVAVPARQFLSPGRSGGGSDTDVLSARLAPEVAHVEVHLDGGPPIEVPIIEGPDQVDENFMVAFVPKGTKVTIVVFDEGGNELQREPVAPSNSWMEDTTEDVSEPPADESKSCMDVRVTILGTEGDDVLEGTPKNDVISGLGGNDTITGVDGDDFVCAGEGDDDVDLGPGFDYVMGGPGDDDLRGGAGTDGVAYWDSKFGVHVDLDIGRPEDSVGWTIINEGDETDGLWSFEIVGGSDHDDVIEGGLGDDQIDGGEGDDVLRGHSGDDLFFGEAGEDDYDGGEGRDYLGFDLIEIPLQIDLTARDIVGDETDRVYRIEVIEGGSGDDVIIGSEIAETLIGAEGNDTLDGAGGDDILWGDYRDMTAKSYSSGGMVIGGTDDSLDGGDGSDEVNGGPGENTCTNGERATDC